MRKHAVGRKKVGMGVRREGGRVVYTSSHLKPPYGSHVGAQKKHAEFVEIRIRGNQMRWRDLGGVLSVDWCQAAMQVAKAAEVRL